MNYSVAGKEQIEIGGEPRQATKVKTSSGDKEIVAWVVEGLPVPARIVEKRNGEQTIELRVKSLL